MIINAQAMINLDMTVRKVLADKDSMALTLVVLVASVAGGFEDIFSSFFGGGRQRDPNAPQKGDDLQYTMTLTFEEAVFGTTKEISIRKDVHVKHVMVMVQSLEQVKRLVVTVMALVM